MGCAEAEARFVRRALGLTRGKRLLDVCCGVGRHDFVLAALGARVVGVDATAEYLAQARRRARGADNPAFVLGDMRRLPFREEFDAAVNLWTSFGYFLDPRDDARALSGVARALKPGGLFLIDLINESWVRAEGLPRNWRRRADGAFVLEELTLVDGRDRGHVNRWTILKDGQPPLNAEFWVRGYDRARLSRALRAAGLIPARAWGGLDGRPWTRLSQRLVLLARKPRSSA